MTEATDSAGMPLNRWDRIVLPLLRYIGGHETELKHESFTIPQLAALADTEGLWYEVGEELTRLADGGYITFTCDPACQGKSAKYTNLRLTERGARTIGMWPPNAPAQVLLSYINVQIEQAESEDERRLWGRLKDAVEDIPSQLIEAMIGWVLGT